MGLERHLRIWHVISTAQFTIAAGLVTVLGLRQIGLNVWAVLALSTPVFALVVLGVLLYGFEVSRGAIGGRDEAEYPLTGSICYRVFYVVTPVVGGVVGALDYGLAQGWRGAIEGWTLGTVIPACIVWLFLDLLIAAIEMALPESRRLRALRVARDRERKEELDHQKRQKVEELRTERRAVLARLAPMMDERTRRLRELLLLSVDDPRLGREEAALIGLEVWQAGGMAVMKEVFTGTVRQCAERGRSDLATHLDYWWDGVGEWRQGEMAPVLPSGEDL